MSRELAVRLECECCPGKIFATSATLRTHAQSMRHRLFESQRENQQLRCSLAAAEADRLRLERLVRDLSTKPRARRVTERVKKMVAGSQQWRCATCSEVLPSCFQVDHVTPLWKGGSNDADNLRALCPTCHATKTQAEWGGS